MNGISLAQVRKLEGKLNLAQASVMGRVGRIALRPLYDFAAGRAYVIYRIHSSRSKRGDAKGEKKQSRPPRPSRRYRVTGVRLPDARFPMPTNARGEPFRFGLWSIQQLGSRRLGASTHCTTHYFPAAADARRNDGRNTCRRRSLLSPSPIMTGDMPANGS